MQEIEETIALIRIEKERVGKNMEDLVSIKDSFESQCLQICQNIRMELDKLPKIMLRLSWITSRFRWSALPSLMLRILQRKCLLILRDIVNQSDKPYGTPLNAIEQQLT